MQNALKTMVARMFADRARRRRRMVLVGVLSVLVACGVFAQLTQPVITKTADPVCGMAVHSHDTGCYADVFVCGEEAGEAHAHGADCIGQALNCSLPEHDHTSACYPEELSEPTIAPEDEPTTEPSAEPTAEASAAPAEGEVDVPTEDMSVESTAEPTIAPETEPTAEPTAEPTIEPTARPAAEPTAEPMPEATETPGMEQISGVPAIAQLSAVRDVVSVGETAEWRYHINGADAIRYTVICGEAFVAAGDGVEPSGSICVPADMMGTYTLHIEAENAWGVQSASADVSAIAASEMQLDVTCDARSCFAGDSVTFRLSAAGGVAPVVYRVEVHQGDALLAAYDEFVDTVAVDTVEGDAVTNLSLTLTAVDAAGRSASAQREIPVALRVYETEAQWAASARTDLTGEWPCDLIAVAETQVGYDESEVNFVVRKDGHVQGYTRYGHWYGSSYEEWCAMFASFCLHYADIPADSVPRAANCDNWISKLKPLDLYRDADEYTPAPGDLIFFDWDEDGESDHVGIVAEVGSEIVTIEGNVSKGVRSKRYDADETHIYGYGLVNAAYAHAAADDAEADDNPVQLEMWMDDTDAGEVIRMAALLDGVDAESYDWQWQTADSPEGEWRDIPGATALECSLPYTEANYNGFYRICGAYDYFAAAPVAHALSDVADSAPVKAPEEYLESAAESPAARGVTGDKDKTIDVHFIQVDQNGFVTAVEEKATTLTIKAPAEGKKEGDPFDLNSWFKALDFGDLYLIKVYGDYMLPSIGDEILLSSSVTYLRVENNGPNYALRYMINSTWSNVSKSSSMFVYYKPRTEYSVTFHDISPDGNEQASFAQTGIAYGTSVAEAMQDVTVFGHPVTDMIWHTAKPAADSNTYDVTAAETVNRDLYTFSYNVSLTLDGSFDQAVDFTAREGTLLSAEDFIVDGVDYAQYQWVTPDGTQQIDIAGLIGTPLKQNIAAVQRVYTVTSTDMNGNTAEQARIPAGAQDPVRVVLPQTYGYAWVCTGEDGTVIEGIDNGDGTITFTFDPLDQNYTIVQEKVVFNVTYDLNLDPEPYDIESQYVPRVNGETLYADAWDVRNGGYTVLAPAPMEYNYRATETSLPLVLMQFDYWVGSDGKTYAPGDLINLTGDMMLTAHWTARTHTDTKVDFYVVYDCEATDVKDVDSKWYTPSVFSAEVITDRTSYNGIVEIIGDGDNFGSQYHDLISKLHTDPYTKDGYTYQLSSYPNNDYVFKQLRALQTKYISDYEDAKKDDPNLTPDIYIGNFEGASKDDYNALIVLDGEIVPVNDIKSDNFTIEWYIFKRQSDGWHIDGRLLPRKASLTITKTFYGDAASIEAVKQNFSITVSGNGETDRTLTLANATGSSGNTYTWTLKETLTRGKEYTIRENGYIADANREYLTAAEYIITNPPDENDQQANRWLRYTSSGVTVKPISYDSKTKTYQTVNLMNIYMPGTTMMIHKVNSVTGASLSGVRFALSNAEGRVSPLYYKDGAYYLDTPAKPYTTVNDGVVTTDSLGRIIIGWAEGSATVSGRYTLTETEAPKGYEPIDPVEFSITDSGGMVTISTDSPDAEAEEQLLRVKNTPQKSHVAVKKVWLDGTDTEEELELYRVDGGSRAYVGKAVLNAENGWEYQWDDMALYGGDGPAVYEVVEKRIGSIYREDSADTDGFPTYAVTMDPMIYQDNNGNAMSGAIVDGQQAYRALLVVYNKRSTGEFTFNKYDQQGVRLPGAEFALYNAGSTAESALATVSANGRVALMANGTMLTPAYTAVSNENGIVSFGTLPIGTYYMVETASPDGYYANTAIYKVEISGSGGTITRNGAALTSISNNRIYVDVTFTKVGTDGPLSGAVFGVYSDEACTTRIAGITTDANGVGKAALPVGSYYLREITAPEGYILSDAVYAVTVSADGTFAIALNGETVTQITNEPMTADVVIHKVDGAGRPLTGASFRIDRDGNPYLYDGKTSVFSPDASFTLQGLKNGSYAITEKSAPLGYYSIIGEITFTVKNGQVTDAACPAGVTFDGAAFTVTNVTGSVLPETGGTGTALYTALGAAIMLLSLLMGYEKLRRRCGRRAMKR